MPTITRVSTPKRSPKTRAVYLDGRWGFNCAANVAEKWGLVAGKELTAGDLEAIKAAQHRQKVMDKALAILSRRLHSEAEMRTKLTRAKYTATEVEVTLAELKRLGYIDDVRFATTKANAAADYRKHGRRRAYVELIKAGVQRETARRASEEVFETKDSMKVARELATRKAPSLRRLDAITARRRLMGMLLRRGFTFDEIKPVLDEVLGRGADEEQGTDE